MKIALVAVNAKYIHSNPAVYSLRGSCDHKEAVAISEYTIHQLPGWVVSDLYRQQPDVIAFSCYIWNLPYVEQLIGDLAQILPKTPIWLGGPEVSYDPEETLMRLPKVTGVMVGEGEHTFSMLVSHYAEGQPALADISGLVFRQTEHGLTKTGCPVPADMDRLPFYYQELPGEAFANRIIYYESSRGCPFSCSYCLSSIDRTVRFRSLSLVKEELQFFLDRRVAQVKFLDRTFNCDKTRACEIWSFLRDHYNGVTNFHFEISADLLDEESLRLLKEMPPGMIQLEIGIQSTNEQTLREIRRTTNLPRLFASLQSLLAGHNIHCHVDLIAGLPYENFASFRRSFDEVYRQGAHQLQLGFLKVLKGSFMEENRQAYGLRYQPRPPYEVLSTNWISYEELVRLKGIEDMVEWYANSGQFLMTLPMLLEHWESPFDFFDELACFYQENGWITMNQSRLQRYDRLRKFYESRLPVFYESEEQRSARLAKLTELLVLDLYAREPLKTRPVWAKPLEESKQRIRRFYEAEAKEPGYLTGYHGYSSAQLSRMTHLEPLSDGRAVLFDYQKRDPLTANARMCWLDWEL